MIRLELPAELAARRIAALGLWEQGGTLAAVAAFYFRPLPNGRQDCMCSMLAVHSERRGRGYGRRMKQAVIDQAKLQRAVLVISYVHAENAAMLRTNDHFGAARYPHPSEPDHFVCLIKL